MAVYRSMPTNELMRIAGRPRVRMPARSVKESAHGDAPMRIPCELWLFVSPTWAGSALDTVPLEETFIATVIDHHVDERPYLPTKGLLDALVKYGLAPSRASPNPSSTPR